MPKTTASYRRLLTRRKQESTLQLLFKCARLLNEQALRRVPREPDQPAPRPAHTALLPHIELEGTRLTDLAERLGVTKQAANQLVDDLERAGALERVPDPKDGRAKLVRFTERGRQGLLQGLQVLIELERELAAQIGKSRMLELRATLSAILERIDPES
jgi:DNA-binding MarR family transcriptional regulator